MRVAEPHANAIIHSVAASCNEWKSICVEFHVVSLAISTIVAVWQHFHALQQR
jgi:hypothetical protein